MISGGRQLASGEWRVVSGEWRVSYQMGKALEVLRSDGSGGGSLWLVGQCGVEWTVGGGGGSGLKGA